MSRNLKQHMKLAMTFITAEGALKIRMVSDLHDDIVDAARTLKATHLVAAFDWDHAEDLPVWSVYDMRKSSSRSGSLPLPIKMFTDASEDPAVMYALAKKAG